MHLKALSIPANATEAPSIAKVWQQLVGNASTFATVWILIIVSALIGMIVEFLYHLWDVIFFATVGYLPIAILENLTIILMTAIPAIYYATDHCPGPKEVLGVLTRKPRRYLGAGFLFCICGVVGFMFCIVPGVLVVLATPLYVHYIFTTDLDLVTCLSKSFKEMFKDFGSFFIVSFLCGLAVVVSLLLCIVPVLAVLPMTQLYMQNYIHHRGLVSAREIA